MAYANKVFGLQRLLRGIRDRRPYPEIPTLALVLSLFLGAVLRVGSYLDLAEQTKRRRWQHLIHWPKRLSDDAFDYVAERLHLEDLRHGLASVAQQLKANKALESGKIHGLLFVSLDANEHFHSRSRCCPCCSQRELEELDAQGQKHTVTEYFHRYVVAQINGPKLNVLLDLEPIRPGEAEAGAALRLLGRMRRTYGVRFFDAVTIDAWYVQGPFLNAIEKLGWLWEVVLKQERMEVFQEARQLSAGQKPVEGFDDALRQRQVQLWDVKDLTFTESYGRAVWVVHSHETWTETKVVGGKKTHQPNTSDWWWMLCDKLKGYPVAMAYAAGHRRWGIENKAFNELSPCDTGDLGRIRAQILHGPENSVPA